MQSNEDTNGQKDCTKPNENNRDTETNTRKEQREYSHC